MTLPLIYALSKSSGSEKRRIINTVRNNNNDPKKIDEVIRFVKESDGMNYARQKMVKYREQAFRMLEKYTDNPTSEALRQLVLFTTERKK